MGSRLLDGIFNFGKHKGKTFKEVLEKEPSYFEWCLKNVKFFFLPKEDIDELKEYKNDLFISELAYKRSEEKEDNFFKEEYEEDIREAKEEEYKFMEEEFLDYLKEDYKEFWGGNDGEINYWNID